MILWVLGSKPPKRQKCGVRSEFFIPGKPAMLYSERVILFLLTHTCPRSFACLPPSWQLLWSRPEAPEGAELLLPAVSQTPNFIFRSELGFEALKTFAASITGEQKQPKQSALCQQPVWMPLWNWMRQARGSVGLFLKPTFRFPASGFSLRDSLPLPPAAPFSTSLSLSFFILSLRRI